MSRTHAFRILALVLVLAFLAWAGPLAAADAAARRAALVAKLEVIVDHSHGDFLILEPEADSGELMEVEMLGLGGDGTLLVMLETYRDSVPPEQALARARVALPAGALVGSWEPATFAQFKVPARDLAAVAAFVDEVFLKLNGLAADYDLFVSVERSR